MLLNTKEFVKLHTLEKALCEDYPSIVFLLACLQIISLKVCKADCSHIREFPFPSLVISSFRTIFAHLPPSVISHPSPYLTLLLLRLPAFLLHNECALCYEA